MNKNRQKNKCLKNCETLPRIAKNSHKSKRSRSLNIQENAENEVKELPRNCQGIAKELPRISKTRGLGLNVFQSCCCYN